MKDWARSFYRSKAWLKCRNGYINKRVGIDGGLCEVCKDDLGFIVHHKVHLTPENISDPEISLNEENLAYVCKACHDQFEGHGLQHAHKLQPLVVFDRDGMPVALTRARACAESGGGEPPV